LTGLLIAQFFGSYWLTTGALVVVTVVLVVLWLLLVALSAALFRRETILTRWR
jgi:hypothetical protein